MSDEVQPITGTKAQVAARLTNFTTGHSEPLSSHKTWLDTEVIPKLRANSASWVDLIGFASRRGNFHKNYTLSQSRCEAVRNYLNTNIGPGKTVRYNIVAGKGEAESGPVESDNSPQFRAVSVFVYEGYQAPPQPAEPRKDERMISKQTFTDITVTHTADDRETGAALGIAKSAVQIAKDISRMSAHPIEQGDPDSGVVSASKMGAIQADWILRSVDVSKVFKDHGVITHFGSWDRSRGIERTYTYHYGPGSPTQKVMVTRSQKTVFDNGKVEDGGSETFQVDQPANYKNP